MNTSRLFPLRLEYLWSMTVIAGIFIFVNTHPIRPQDFWWHITVGKQIIETRVIPSVDTFSYTMYGEPYLSYQMFWLMEVMLYVIYSFGGPAMTVFVQGLMITTAYALILYICFKLTRSWRTAAFGGIFAAALGMNDWNVRPQSVTFLLGALIIWAIYSYRRTMKLKYIIILPISMIIWVNSHGTFPIGIALIGIWLVDEFWRSISKSKKFRSILSELKIPLATFIVTCLALLVNPRGIRVIGYLFTMSSNQSIQNLVPEWSPPAIDTLSGGLFYFSLLLVSIIWAISSKKPGIFQILSYLLFAILGISTSRGIIWFGLVLAPVISFHIYFLGNPQASEKINNKNKNSNLINSLIFVFLIFAVIITLPWFKDKLPLPPSKAGLISSETPLNATEYLLQGGFPTQVFHSMSYGSYLIWAAQPMYKVFVDSRIELYPTSIWKDYLSISNAQDDWEDKLAHYRINTLMLNLEEQSPLVHKIRESDRWSLVYEEGNVFLFTLNNID